MNFIEKKKLFIPILVVDILVVFIYGVLLINSSIDKNSKFDQGYVNTSNIDYNVYLKQNDFYKEDYITKDKQYIASLIDYIDVFYDYTFNNNNLSNLKYSYYVVANVLVNNLQGKNIYKSEKTIVPKTAFESVKDNKFEIKENVKINYDEFNDLANDFIDSYGINAEGKVLVSLYVDVVGENKDGLSNKPVISLDIPLTKKNTDITMNYDLVNDSNSVSEKRVLIGSIPMFSTGILLIILDLAAIFVFIWPNIKSQNKQTDYSKKLKKILRVYEGYITETKMTESAESLLKTRSLRVELVNSIEDLINVRDSIEKPILYHEDVPGETAIFYIMDEKLSYVYIMKADETSEEKSSDDLIKAQNKTPRSNSLSRSHINVSKANNTKI